MHFYVQHMNPKRVIIGIVSLLVAAAIIGMLWAFFSPKQTGTAPTAQNPVTLPSSGSVTVPVDSGTGAPATSTAAGMSVTARDGSTVVTTDFIHNGITIADAANTGRYLLAGDLGYCITDPAKCQAGSYPDFNIFYDTNAQSFTIALLAEPLGATRSAAEQFLMQTLGIGQADMCKLNYYVGATYWINALFASKNLGFSFCPGATQLPQ